jgi:hydroxypyruvate isomerase
MPKFDANITMLYTELDFLDRFAAARADGFKGIEYLFPYAYPKHQLHELLHEHDLVQVLHNLPAGDWAKGERGIACLPDRKAEFQESVGKAIEYASELHCPQVNCLAGIKPDNVTAAQAHDTLVENLQFAAPLFAKAGIKLLIEAINPIDIPGFFLNTTRQSLGVIADVGSDNLFVQYDIYHMQITEGDLARTMRAHLDLIPHIQLADNPGRHEPGTGEINYPFLFSFLDRIGYKGWIGCEYKPMDTTASGMHWIDPYRR